MVANLCDRLHHAIESELDTATLHDIVDLWELNNLNEDLTFEHLVRWGAPNACDDCQVDVTPHDEYGRAVERGWEWYMVLPAVWQAASNEDEPRYLCIGCLEERLGRHLVARDFSNLGINESGRLASARLADRLEAHGQ